MALRAGRMGRKAEGGRRGSALVLPLVAPPPPLLAAAEEEEAEAEAEAEAAATKAARACSVAIRAWLRAAEAVGLWVPKSALKWGPKHMAPAPGRAPVLASGSASPVHRGMPQRLLLLLAAGAALGHPVASLARSFRASTREGGREAGVVVVVVVVTA